MQLKIDLGINIVWYHIPTNQMYIDSSLEGIFYALSGLNRTDSELIGFL